MMRLQVHPVVFSVSAGVILLFVLIAVLFGVGAFDSMHERQLKAEEAQLRESADALEEEAAALRESAAALEGTIWLERRARLLALAEDRDTRAAAKRLQADDVAATPEDEIHGINVFAGALDGVKDWITRTFGWFYVLAATGFLIFAFWLFFSRYGSIRLGKDDERPEFSLLTWFAMLFSAGMGIGLLFWSVAEPMSHFMHPAPGTAEGGSTEAARQAMVTTFFHWGLHAWAIYIVMGLSLAYFSYRHDLPLTIRSCLYPLLGQKIYGRFGDAIEIVAVFGTLFGIATSLGLGAIQIATGLEFAGVLGPGSGGDTTVQVLVIAAVTFAATISVFTGLHVGIRRLSEMNLLLGLALILFVFLLGPTLLLLNVFVQNTGSYIGSLATMSFDTLGYQGDDGVQWQGWWTMFYWGWWISWSPFVGMFIARVSRGRTIRAFVGGVLLVPTALTLFWLTVFGNTGIFLEQQPEKIIGEAAVAERVEQAPDGNPSTFTHFPALSPEEAEAYEEDPTSVPVLIGEDGEPFKNERDRMVKPERVELGHESALFALLSSFPLAVVTILIATLVIATFFVTSSDSGSLVLDIITSGGNPDPPRWQRVFWAVLEGVIAAILLIVGADAALNALQAAAITTALPFAVIMVFICVALIRGLRKEVRSPHRRGLGLRLGRPQPPTVQEAKAATVHEQPEDPAEVSWQERLKRIAEARMPTPEQDKKDRPHRSLEAFIKETVAPTFEELKKELEGFGRKVTVRHNGYEAEIKVNYEGDEEFSYAIRGRAHHGMSFAFPVMSDERAPWVYSAAVEIDGDRRSDHPLDSFTPESIIEDFLSEYATWKGWTAN